MAEVLATVAALRARVAAWRGAGERVALVPTMGALHEGHVSLVDLALKRADRVVVSVFVNPTQFAPTEDLARYPRPFAEDVRRVGEAKGDAVFAPDVAEMYPPGDSTRIVPSGPAKAGLEDVVRPTHFEGVATVVAKLLLQALPDVAVFGEKDWQQLCVVRALVRDLMIPVEIVGAPTIRAADGLALSSRNIYLSAEERARAPALHAALSAAAVAIRRGADPDEAAKHAAATLEAQGFTVDYLAARAADSLGPPDADGPIRLLAAARLGATRLIDNVEV